MCECNFQLGWDEAIEHFDDIRSYHNREPEEPEELEAPHLKKKNQVSR